MSNAKRDDFAAALRAEIVGVLVRESGAPETHAIRMASMIMQAVSHRWQGTKAYVRAPDRYDRETVLRDLATMSPEEVCRRHGISRWTVQRLRQRDAS
ncbi:MAG: hypothetical protein NTZ11_18340 [Gammaproteobacteria bacterium]|nr:hypothetical protein [Gammaproteobacteria bacterium]